MPLPAPGPNDPHVLGFLTEIRIAQERLDAAIIEAILLPDTTPGKQARIRRYNALKREIDLTFRKVTESARVWSQTEIPRSYTEGFVVGALTLDAGLDFSLIHREAVDRLVNDSFNDVATRLQQVSTSFGDKIDAARTLEELSIEQRSLLRTSGRSAITQQLLTGLDDVDDTAAAIRRSIWEGGVSIIDAAGRNWNPETYTRMLVRTKSAMAYSSGSLNKYAEEGVTRVYVMDGVLDDDECARANGETWTLRYAMNHMIEHPNCRRAFAPIPGQGKVQRSEAIDKVKKSAEFGLRAELYLNLIQRALKYRSTGVLDLDPGLLPGIRLDRIGDLSLGPVSAAARNLDSALHIVEWELENLINPLARRLRLIEGPPAGIDPIDWQVLTKRLQSRIREAEEFRQAVEEARNLFYGPARIEQTVPVIENNIAPQDVLERFSAKLSGDGVEVNYFDNELGEGLAGLLRAIRNTDDQEKLIRWYGDQNFPGSTKTIRETAIGIAGHDSRFPYEQLDEAVRELVDREIRDLGGDLLDDSIDLLEAVMAGESEDSLPAAIDTLDWILRGDTFQKTVWRDFVQGRIVGEEE